MIRRSAGISEIASSEGVPERKIIFRSCGAFEDGMRHVEPDRTDGGCEPYAGADRVAKVVQVPGRGILPDVSGVGEKNESKTADERQPGLHRHFEERITAHGRTRRIDGPERRSRKSPHRR